MDPSDPTLRIFYNYHQRPPQHHQAPPSQPPPATTTTTDTRTLPHQTLSQPTSVSHGDSSPSHTDVRQKRGRPRKYNSPEEATAAKKQRALSSRMSTKDVPPAVGGVSTNSSMNSVYSGNAGQGFTHHVITVTTGEDITRKIMSFMQQSKQEICVMSATGVISSASLRLPATLKGNSTYQGHFDIISLCGSYAHVNSGNLSGGLSICMSGPQGEIIGGGVFGPLIAAGPVQVIVGTFVINSKKTDTNAITIDKVASITRNPKILNFSGRGNHGVNHSSKKGHLRK